jgi:uncharacterized SAM-binding protein YcdF (DUF218 family)
MHFLTGVGGIFASPLVFCFLLALVGALLRLFGLRKPGSILWILAASLVYLASIPLVGNLLLEPLERKYPSVFDHAPPGASWVVVCGSGYAPRLGVPVTASLDDDGLARVVEGLRLARQYGASRLLLSGGSPRKGAEPARGYLELAKQLGFDQQSIEISDQAQDTAAEAKAVVMRLGDTPFLLVTSAYHMPRAMWLMQRAGARPIPAPTGQLVDRAGGWEWNSLVPSSAGLRKSERALHEYLGLVAALVHLR